MINNIFRNQHLTNLHLNQPIAYLLKRLVKSCDISVDYRELEFQLMSHPSYPSLHSITGVLDHFGITNLAVEIPVDEESFVQLPEFFLTRITNHEGAHFVLVKKKGTHCEVTFDKRKKQSLPISEFIAAWTGIVVVVEKNVSESAEESVKIDLSLVMPSIGLAVLIVIPFLLGVSLFESSYYFLSILGAFLSGLIVMQELGIHSVALDKFCGEENSATSCDQVLNSKGATLFGFMKLSELGLVYFSGLTIFWLGFVLAGVDFEVLFWPTMLSILITFYSVSYQITVVKKWCLLCLSIVAVLWLQGAWVYLSVRPTLPILIGTEEVLGMLVCFLFSAVVVQFALPKLRKEQELKQLKIDHVKFKRNYNLFSTLMGQSAPIKTAIDKDEMVFGRVDKVASLEIVIVTNPLCGHCKSAHEIVEPIISRFKDKVRLCIRYNVRITHPEDLSVRIAARLLEIYHTEEEDVSLSALHDAYGAVQFQSWLDKWGEHTDPIYLETLKKESDWSEENGINFTPEILVNGRSFPHDYDRIDLLYFVEDLIEEYESQTEEAADPINEIIAQSYSQ